ncbi:hypothetical protein NX862_04710, partial [Rhodobacter sp. KR11]|uniref:hypothetical protein n=1 Tax=Rhodobacter sp. KR11 TaxID=2974588 RepID=UPI0022234D2E
LEIKGNSSGLKIRVSLVRFRLWAPLLPVEIVEQNIRPVRKLFLRRPVWTTSGQHGAGIWPARLR